MCDLNSHIQQDTQIVTLDWRMSCASLFVCLCKYTRVMNKNPAMPQTDFLYGHSSPRGHMKDETSVCLESQALAMLMLTLASTCKQKEILLSHWFRAIAPYITVVPPRD